MTYEGSVNGSVFVGNLFSGCNQVNDIIKNFLSEDLNLRSDIHLSYGARVHSNVPEKISKLTHQMMSRTIELLLDAQSKKTFALYHISLMNDAKYSSQKKNHLGSAISGLKMSKENLLLAKASIQKLNAMLNQNNYPPVSNLGSGIDQAIALVGREIEALRG